MMPVKEESTPLADPSAPHTHINAAEFTCEGFPHPLTQADIDALYKRALDAEDHLRAEVVRCQSIIDRQAEMERVASCHRNAAWDARKEVDAVTERLRMSRKSARDNLKEHMNVSQVAIQERDDTIAVLRVHLKTADEVAAMRAAEVNERDATIANLRSIVDKRDKGLASLQEKLQARDQTIADLQALRAKLESITDDVANTHGQRVRSSIVTFLSNLASAFDGAERELVYTLVTQIQRGDDCTG